MADDREFKLDLPADEEENKPKLHTTNGIPKSRPNLRLDPHGVHKRRSRSDYVKREEVKENWRDSFGARRAAQLQKVLFGFVVLVFAYYLVPIVVEALSHE